MNLQPEDYKILVGQFGSLAIMFWLSREMLQTFKGEMKAVRESHETVMRAERESNERIMTQVQNRMDTRTEALFGRIDTLTDVIRKCPAANGQTE